MIQPQPSWRGMIAAEFAKLLGRRWLLWAAAAPAVAVVLQGCLSRLEAVQQAIANGGSSADVPGFSTAFTPAAQALASGAAVAAVIVSIFAALSLAEERRLGTLRTLLAAPITRARFFATKCSGVLLLSVILVGSSALVALATGAFFADYVAIPDWEYTSNTVARMWGVLALAVALATAAVFALGCLALLASAATSSGTGALLLLGGLVAAIRGFAIPWPPATREMCRAFSPLSYITRPAEYLGEQVAGIGGSSWCYLLLPSGNEHWEPLLPWAVCLAGATLWGALGLLIFARRQVL